MQHSISKSKRTEDSFMVNASDTQLIPNIKIYDGFCIRIINSGTWFVRVNTAYHVHKYLHSIGIKHEMEIGT